MREYTDLVEELKSPAPDSRRRVLRKEAADAIKVLEMRLEVQQKLYKAAFIEAKKAKFALKKAIKDMRIMAAEHDICAVCAHSDYKKLCDRSDGNCAKCSVYDSCICRKCVWDPQFEWRGYEREAKK